MLNVCMTEAQLNGLLYLVEANIGAKEAEAGRKALREVVGLRKK